MRGGIVAQFRPTSQADWDDMVGLERPLDGDCLCSLTTDMADRVALEYLLAVALMY
jgi:hypothetical protein